MGPIGDVRPDEIQELGDGILELEEPERALYVASGDSLSAIVATFVGAKFWDAIGNHFWHPDVYAIRARALPHSSIEGSLADWKLRLIQFDEPVFNMRVKSKTAA